MAGRPDPARVAAVDEDRFEMRPIAPRLCRLKTRLQRLLTPAATALLGAAALALPAAADAQPLQLRIVGGLASLNQYRLHEEPFWSHRLSTLTQGRIQAEIVPFDRAGIRGQDMLRLLQLGVVPFGTALLSLAATEDPLVNMADLPGANPDIDTLRRAVAALVQGSSWLVMDAIALDPSMLRGPTSAGSETEQSMAKWLSASVSVARSDRAFHTVSRTSVRSLTPRAMSTLLATSCSRRCSSRPS